jgi:guanine deaminase
VESMDSQHLASAIELSRCALQDEAKTPFGAIVVNKGQVIGKGTSSVVELSDPTAHAEVMAIRAAGKALGRHLMPEAVMYTSSEPCPMCLVACYWAQIPRIVYGANSLDVAKAGFEDWQFYRELTAPASDRTLIELGASEPLRSQAIAVLRSWTDALPEPVQPKF